MMFLAFSMVSVTSPVNCTAINEPSLSTSTPGCTVARQTYRAKRLREMLLLRRSLVVRRPPARLLGDLASWVESLDTAKGFLEDTISLLD